MKVIEPWIEVEPFDGTKIMKKLERACRTCYRSEGSITEDSYKKLLTNCINRGHESILEHEKVTIRMCVDVGCYKDLTRHRFGSFSIESTRYCCYDKDKFGNEINFIKPIFLRTESTGTIEIFQKEDLWKECMRDIEKTYMKMRELGATPDECRMILPHSTAAEVTMTANIREWKHIFELRCSNRAHPSIQQVLIPLLLHFKKQMPEIFDKVPYNEKFPKQKYAKLTVMKGDSEE